MFNVKTLAVLLIAAATQTCNGMKVSFAHQAGDTIVNFNSETLKKGSGNIVINAICEEASEEGKLAWAVFHGRHLHQFGQDKTNNNQGGGKKYCCDTNTELQAGYVCADGLIIKEEAAGRIYGGMVNCLKPLNMEVNESQINEDGYWYAVVLPYLVQADAHPQSFKGEFIYKSKTGYLSAEQYPQLVAHYVISAIYVIMAVVWFVLMACYYRDILKLQYWTSAVLLLSMIQMSMFTGWYRYSNTHGMASKPLLGFSVFVMVAMLSIVSMLILFVSNGYGVMKPSLGEEMYRILGFGMLFFTTSLIYWEAHYMEQAHAMGLSKAEESRLSKLELYAILPASLLDACLVVWTVQSLYNTMSQLKTRNKLVKYNMYYNFFIVLISAVLIGIACMVIQFLIDKSDNWQYHWFKSVAWKVIFLFVLLSIMVIWRPSNNISRFAYTPLDNEDEEDLQNIVPTAYVDMVKMRVVSSRGDRDEEEEDLNWAEENVPSTNNDLLFDDEEERETKRFELNKMQ